MTTLSPHARIGSAGAVSCGTSKSSAVIGLAIKRASHRTRIGIEQEQRIAVRFHTLISQNESCTSFSPFSSPLRAADAHAVA